MVLKKLICNENYMMELFLHILLPGVGIYLKRLYKKLVSRGQWWWPVPIGNTAVCSKSVHHIFTTVCNVRCMWLSHYIWTFLLEKNGVFLKLQIYFPNSANFGWLFLRVLEFKCLEIDWIQMSVCLRDFISTGVFWPCHIQVDWIWMLHYRSAVLKVRRFFLHKNLSEKMNAEKVDALIIFCPNFM